MDSGGTIGTPAPVTSVLEGDSSWLVTGAVLGILVVAAIAIFLGGNISTTISAVPIEVEVDDSIEEVDGSVPGGEVEVGDSVVGGEEEVEDSIAGGEVEVGDSVPGGEVGTGSNSVHEVKIMDAGIQMQLFTIT